MSSAICVLKLAMTIQTKGKSPSAHAGTSAATSATTTAAVSDGAAASLDAVVTMDGDVNVIVDGAEAALYGFYGAKLYEVAPYLSLTTHTYSPSFLIVSKSFWNKLTAEQQKVFREVADQITGIVAKSKLEEAIKGVL